MAVVRQRPKTFNMPITNNWSLLLSTQRQEWATPLVKQNVQMQENPLAMGLQLVSCVCLCLSHRKKPSRKSFRQRRFCKRLQSMSCSKNSTWLKRIWLLFFRQYVRHQWRNSMASNEAASAKWRMDSAEFLGGILFDAYSSLQIRISPSRHHVAATSTPLKETVAQLGTYSEWWNIKRIWTSKPNSLPNLSTSMGEKRISSSWWMATNLMEETNFSFAALTGTLITQIQTEAYLKEIMPERRQMMLRQRMICGEGQMTVGAKNYYNDMWTCDTAEPKTPGVPWCSEFFVPNIKHKGTPRILSKLLKPRTSLVFRGVLSPRKLFMS